MFAILFYTNIKGLPNDKEGMESFVEKFKRMKKEKESKSQE
jgi:hypothetical protein